MDVAYKKFKILNLKFKILKIALIAIILVVSSSHYSFANSEYVLPYPSEMPGSKLYKFNLVKEKILKFWYFGDFGQFKYSLGQSDKYLVEAKILFEYKQYLLGFEALEKSNAYFKQTLPNLLEAQKKGKNINTNRNILAQASGKHIEVLGKIEQNVPVKFVWTPEKEASTTLNLKDLIKEAVGIRKKYL